jgi:hypothetical protein
MATEDLFASFPEALREKKAFLGAERRVIGGENRQDDHLPSLSRGKGAGEMSGLGDVSSRRIPARRSGEKGAQALGHLFVKESPFKDPRFKEGAVGRELDPFEEGAPNEGEAMGHLLRTPRTFGGVMQVAAVRGGRVIGEVEDVEEGMHSSRGEKSHDRRALLQKGPQPPTLQLVEGSGEGGGGLLLC